MSNSGSEMPVRRKTHQTSDSTAQSLFPNQNIRYQEVYPTPLQGRERGGNSENPGNPRRGPCFNCKEYGHYSRDCPEVHGIYDTPTKEHYYSLQQEDTRPRPLKTETYPRHYHPPSRNPSYTECPEQYRQRPSRKPQYKEYGKNDDEEGYPLSDFEENTTPSNKNIVPGKTL